MRKHIFTSTIVGVLVPLVIGLGAPAATADSTRPYGDQATAQVADRLHGKQRGGWLATTLGYGGNVSYQGPRKAEIVKVPAGHGRRWVGIIHVKTPERAQRVRASLVCRAWFARSGTRFVLPLRSSTWTDGGGGASYKQAAKWAKRRLGTGWAIH